MNVEIYQVIITLGILVFATHAFNELFSKTKIPTVLLLIFVGIIFGPVTGFINRDFMGELGNIFSTVTLIVILFESGISLKIAQISKAIASATWLTFFNFSVTMAIGTLAGRYLSHMDWLSASFLGASVGCISAAVVIPMLKQLNMHDRSKTTLFLESAFSDVLCLIVALAILEGIEAKQVHLDSIFTDIWQSFFFALLIGLFGGLFWSFILNSLRSVKNSMFTTPAFVFVVYGLAEMAHYNGGIAALAFGIVLGNADLLKTNRITRKIIPFKVTELDEKEIDFFGEIVFLLQTYFFVYIGICIPFGAVSSYVIAGIVVLLTILFRVFSIRVTNTKGFSRKDIQYLTSMNPKGLITAVLASLPFQMGLPFGNQIQELAYAIVLISIIVSSILVIIISNSKGDKLEKDKQASGHIDEVFQEVTPETMEQEAVIEERM